MDIKRNTGTFIKQKGVEFAIYWAKRLSRKHYLHSGNLRNYQAERIHDIVSHARSTSPFYENLYKDLPANFQLKTLNDIYKIPVVKKDMFKTACSQNLILTKNSDKEKLICEYTTGSTGVPSKILFTKDTHKKTRKVGDRMLHNAGIRRYEKYCMIWRQKSLSQRNLKRLQSGLYIFPTVGDITNSVGSAFSQDRLASSVRSIIDFNPQFIHGYVSALFCVARYLENNNLRIPALKRVIATAEYLPPNIWDVLERVFNRPIINYYGASEAGAIACNNSSSRNMIISEDLYFVEVLDENDQPVKPGQPGGGLITLTNLTATAMPLIRYQIGDMAIVDDSFYDYGEDFRYFVSVEGRTNDVFELEDGSVIFSHLWHIIFREELWIERFQVIQKSRSFVEIKIIPVKPDERNFSSLKQSIQERFEGIEFDFKIVNKMELGAGNKFRAVMSEVPNKFNSVNK